jgi:hypothetical protein
MMRLFLPPNIRQLYQNRKINGAACHSSHNETKKAAGLTARHSKIPVNLIFTQQLLTLFLKNYEISTDSFGPAADWLPFGLRRWRR